MEGLQSACGDGARMRLTLAAVIFLSFVLALGFLLLILSCALWSDWLLLLSAATFVFAPMPDAAFGRLAGADSFSDYNSAYVDVGNFLTAAMVLSGAALPIVLAHAGLVATPAAIMALTGGVLVYGTMITYSAFFNNDLDDV